MKAVIFDMDGVLVDSFNANLEAFNVVMKKRFGFIVSRKEFLGLFGRDPREITRVILETHNIKDVDIAGIYGEKRTVFNSVMEKEVRLFPGVVESLSKLKETGFKLALASSNSRESIARIMEKTRLESFFEAYVGYEDTSRAKPDPEIFLKAAERLGVSPGDCWVIEDSLPGVMAGKTAGMSVVGVQTGMRSERELLDAGADLTVKTLEELDAGDLRENA